MDGRYEGEHKFETLLKSTGLSFVFHRSIRLYGVVLCTPDYYLPSYDGYCEIVSNRQTLSEQTMKRRRKAIAKGFNFTFYDHRGKKLVLSDLQLSRLGLESNDELFTIMELE